MSVVFKFTDKSKFDKAKKALDKAIYTMASPHFNHSIQDSEKTITVLTEKNAEIIEKFFKENRIDGYEKEKDMSWIGPEDRSSSLPFLLNKVANELNFLRKSHMNPLLIEHQIRKMATRIATRIVGSLEPRHFVPDIKVSV